MGQVTPEMLLGSIVTGMADFTVGRQPSGEWSPVRTIQRTEPQEHFHRNDCSQ